MALWQFEFFIIPKKNVVTNICLDNEEILSWGKQSTSIEDIDFLEKQKGWTDKISQFGKEDETCIKFIYINGLLAEISCRLDLRTLSKGMLRKILDFINKMDGMIFYENKMYSPNIEEIVELIKKSKANKFCQNPRNYFEEMFKC
ncbi:MAG: hypothetical protein HFJ09_14000 [Lachnospiraceae bacterium]|nr:hypothetical protein [Lachnospiraceae bacterium]